MAKVLNVWLLAVVAVLVSASTSSADQIIVPVQLHDFAALPEKVLRDSQTKITSIFSAAGITIVWVDPSQLSHSDRPKNLLTIDIMPEAVARRMSPHGEPLGFTPVGATPGYRAYVFAFRIDEQARRCAQDKDTVLAAVMAHEMGHLLLPGVAHSARGIMRAQLGLSQFQMASQGTLLFLPDQARTMRAQIQGN
jgi:hypothetical protein